MPIFDLIAAACPSRSRSASAQALVNLYPEVSADQGITLYGTPGISLLSAIGSGPIRGMFQFGRELYLVSGTEVYSLSDAMVATLLGSLRSGFGRVYFASNGTDTMLVDGVSGYRIESGDLLEIDDEDFPAGVTWCDYVDGFYLVGGDGSQKFYKSGLLDGSDWDGLDFASAEGDPDPLLRGIVSSREILLFGTRTLEFWTNTGAANFPFERSGNAFVEQGCLARDSVAKLDSGVFWLGRSAEGQGIVWRLNGYTPVRISTHAEEFEIGQWSNPSDAYAWTYVEEGHSFYVLSSASGDASLVYDVASGRWHQRRWRDGANNLHRVRGFCYAFFAGRHVVGDHENPNVYRQSLDTYTDNGAAIPRVIVGQHSRSGKRRLYGELELLIETGTTSLPDGMAPPADAILTDRCHGLMTEESTYILTEGESSPVNCVVAPQAVLSVSDDGGRTFHSARARSLGKLGDYKGRVVWTRNGSAFTRTFKVEITDPVPVAITGARLEFRE